MAKFHLIKTICRQKGITLAELAERIGKTPAGITIIINSGSTNTKTIEDIARELGVKVGVFFDDPEPSEQEQTDVNSIIAQKDEIIAQKDKIIEQKDAIIGILANSRR